MLVISLSLTESKTPYPLTSSTHFPTSFITSSKDVIVTPTPTAIEGK